MLADDRLLLSVLLGRAPDELRSAHREGDLYTTGLWYYRLCHASRSARVTGALSGPLASAPEPARTEAVAALTALPDTVGMLSFRGLAPEMAELVERHRLNLLSLEAIAAALSLASVIRLAAGNDNPAVMSAAEAEGIDCRLLDP
ncbi:MAG: hypothetical protein ACR2G7_00210 [Acidimicrobiales bacterium]